MHSSGLTQNNNFTSQICEFLIVKLLNYKIKNIYIELTTLFYWRGKKYLSNIDSSPLVSLSTLNMAYILVYVKLMPMESMLMNVYY